MRAGVYYPDRIEKPRETIAGACAVNPLLARAFATLCFRRTVKLNKRPPMRPAAGPMVPLPKNAPAANGGDR